MTPARKKKLTRTAALMAVLSFVLMGADDCDGGEEAPAVDSDSSQNYEEGSKVPVDTEVYEITGQVTTEVNSLERQVKPAEGSMSGTLYGNYGTMQGSYFGPVEKGKGYVRLLVGDASPEVDLATPGQVAILKVSDTKATALVPGDIVTFKCRRQYEAIAPVKERQKFDADAVETWELDYCRLASPEILVKPATPEAN